MSTLLKDIHELGPIADRIARRLDILAANSFPDRLFAQDPTLWSDEPSGQAEIRHRLGWMTSPQKARAKLPAYQEFATQVQDAGISRYLVIGMGGSSLATEVLSSVFSSKDVPKAEVRLLGILDSTDPSQVAQATADFPPGESLYIVSSKSGVTTEVTAAFDYLWAQSNSDSSRFVAITNEGTSLEQMARELRFRRVFIADSTVGGRFSALTDFGMVPAALLGVDLDRLLSSAERMQLECGQEVPVQRNPGIVLGAVLGEAAAAGRDKLAIISDSSLGALPEWIEQLVAESSGKNGKGILPVVLEPLDVPDVYGPDRLFVYIRKNGELDAGVQALRQAGFPVISHSVPEGNDVAAEFFRWEMAVAVACHILGVNAFDQPDVQESKDRTRSKIAEFHSIGRLMEGDWDVTTCDRQLQLGASGKFRSFLGQAVPGNYIAINAYLPRRQDVIDELQRQRVLIRERTHLAVTAGFGPRFQHSTGQLHKGGPNNGLFIQIVSDTAHDLQIPGQDLSFGTLIRAQALGDYETLVARGRRVLRVLLANPEDLCLVTKALQ
jgi:transaldolase/glucose-6-phosphate isomerase